MAFMHKFLILTIALGVLAGCTSIKQMTGQIDSTKLPGQREDILPPDQQQARDPAITGQPLPPDPGQGNSAARPALPQRAMSAKTGQESITDATPRAGADCDPKVDLCPQQTGPDPLPPPSPLKPEKVASAKTAAMAKSTSATSALAKPVKKRIKKKKHVGEAVPPEPKLDAPPPPGPADAPPKPQSQ